MSILRCLSAACLVLPIAAGVASAGPPTSRDGPLGMRFVPVPKGTFFMGWDGDQGRPRRTEIRESLEIAVHLVTQGQWQEVMGRNPSYFSRTGGGKDKVKAVSDDDLKEFPVDNVSWNDVRDFVGNLNERESGKGYVYRLPTDEEWEYACRGAARTEAECSHHFYSDQPTNDLTFRQANFDKGEKGPGPGRTTKVGSYPPNALGLYDMHGNLWQWTDTPEPSSKGLRGGSWFNEAGACRAAFRPRSAPSNRDDDRGFRLVRVPLR